MNIEELFAPVAQEVPDAPSLLVQSKCRDVLRKLYCDSEVWTQDVAIALVADQASYVALPPDGAAIHKIKSVRPQDTQVDLTETRESAMNLVSQSWRIDKAERPTRYVPSVEPAALSVYPTPSASGLVLLTKLVLFPARTATAFHDWIAEKHFDGIVAGVVGALHRVPNRPWTDLKLAGDGDAELGGVISSLRMAASKEGASGIRYARTTGFEEL